MSDIVVLDEVADLLRDSACLYHGLAELADEPTLRACATKSAGVRIALVGQFRNHRLELAGDPALLSNPVLVNRDAALRSLACADLAGALRDIATCDAAVLHHIGRRAATANLSKLTLSVLHLALNVLHSEAASRAHASAETPRLDKRAL